MIPDRLTSALPKLAESLQISAYEIAPLTGDASNRSYFRLKTEGRTFVVMLLAEGFQSLAEQQTKISKKVVELPFIDVGRYLENKGVHVPKLQGYDSENGVLILEDFGDQFLQETNEREPLYEDALDQLERLAVISEDDPKTSIAFSRRFDRDLYNWEFLHFVEYGLDQRLEQPPSPSEREKIVGELSRLTETYLTWEPVISHRDYHSRNLMVLNPTHVGVIDFQDAFLAPLFYDLASLLRDSYVDIDSKLQDQLVERYRNQMKLHKLPQTSSKEEFRKAFDLMGLHRNLKAAGRFCYMDMVKENRRYLADVPRTLGYVRETLKRYSELKALKTLLQPYLSEVIETCK